MRSPGLSAMIRIKNEQDWLPYCLDSILNWFDEICIFLQPCTDNSIGIAKDYALMNEHVKVFTYPYDSWPNGEWYYAQDSTSEKSRTYFYNWCLKRTTKTHVCKWDGDMVAMDWLGEIVTDSIKSGFESIRMYGVDIVGDDLSQLGKRAFCANEPRVFRMRSGVRYINGSLCEKIEGIAGQQTINIKKPAFIHTKWVKPISTATQAWPFDWMDSLHFQNIIERAIPTRQYNGEYPTVMKALVS